MEFIIRHKLLSIIGVIVFLGGGWYVLSSSGGGDATNLVATGATSQDSQQLLLTLNELHAVKLDSSVLSSAAFQSLQDFTTPIVPEAVGRTDPFAPLSATAVVTASTTKSAAMFKPRQ